MTTTQATHTPSGRANDAGQACYDHVSSPGGFGPYDFANIIDSHFPGYEELLAEVEAWRKWKSEYHAASLSWTPDWLAAARNATDAALAKANPQ